MSEATIGDFKFYRTTDEFSEEPGFYAITPEGRVLLWMGGNNFVDMTGTNPFFQFENEAALLACYTSQDPKISITEVPVSEVKFK